jgi:hypothetical protein
MFSSSTSRERERDDEVLIWKDYNLLFVPTLRHFAFLLLWFVIVGGSRGLYRDSLIAISFSGVMTAEVYCGPRIWSRTTNALSSRIAESCPHWNNVVWNGFEYVQRKCPCISLVAGGLHAYHVDVLRVTCMLQSEQEMKIAKRFNLELFECMSLCIFMCEMPYVWELPHQHSAIITCLPASICWKGTTSKVSITYKSRIYHPYRRPQTLRRQIISKLCPDNAAISMWSRYLPPNNPNFATPDLPMCLVMSECPAEIMILCRCMQCVFRGKIERPGRCRIPRFWLGKCLVWCCVFLG